MSEVIVRETTSTPIQFQILSGAAGMDLSSYDPIVLYLKDNTGSAVAYSTAGTPAQLAINGATGGSAMFTPGTADLLWANQPYSGYFQLYTSPTAWLFAPEDSEFSVSVRKTF